MVKLAYFVHSFLYCILALCRHLPVMQVRSLYMQLSHKCDVLDAQLAVESSEKYARRYCNENAWRHDGAYRESRGAGGGGGAAPRT